MPPDLFELWKAIGELTALLWLPEIDDMDGLLVSTDVPLFPKQTQIRNHQKAVNIATDNVLDLFSKIQPSKMITKPKLHLLTHLAEDIKRFGPLITQATEAFEGFHGVFRSCSILSNHQAPSRDIALQLADQEGFKQRVTGGWWPDGSGGWKHSGSGVRDSLERYKMLKNNLGWADNTATPPGLSQLTFRPTSLTPLTQERSGLPRSQHHKLGDDCGQPVCGDPCTLLQPSTPVTSVGIPARSGSLGRK